MSGVLHHTIVAADPPSGVIDIAVSESERAALAEEYGLQAVKAFSAQVETRPISGGVKVDGRLTADIVQTCVVSLVPVEEHIDETFSVRFLREAPPAPKPGDEILVDADVPDPPELLEGPTLDLGALAEEYFALAINPYPRAPGAELPADLGEPLGAADSPFAVLADLAKSPRAKR
jgi:uncharacterized metal-binding protein YceD (DUF177 family)